MNLTSEHEVGFPIAPSVQKQQQQQKKNSALKCLLRCEDFDILACKGIAKLMAALLHNDHLVMVECPTM